MEKVKVSLWQLTLEEFISLPKGTQIIEYNTFTGRMHVRKKGEFKDYDFFSRLYLLAAPDKEKA